MYQPFFTTKGERGTGLGLWVSAGIVKIGEHTSSGSLGHMFICLPTRQKGVTVSNRTLTLNRLVHPVVPPHVDYSLTPAGHKFAEAVTLLCEWAVQNKALLKQVVGRGTH